MWLWQPHTNPPFRFGEAVPHKTGRMICVCMHACRAPKDAAMPWKEKDTLSTWKFCFSMSRIEKQRCKIHGHAPTSNNHPERQEEGEKEQHHQISHLKSIRFQVEEKNVTCIWAPVSEAQTDFNVFSTSLQFPTSSSHILNYFCSTLASAAPNMSTLTWKPSWRWL